MPASTFDYESAYEKRQSYFDENYMSVFDPVSKVKMTVLKDIGNMLVNLGWEVLKMNAYSEDKNEEDTYYDDSEGINDTERFFDATTMVLSTDFATEVSTEGTITDATTEVIYDLVATTDPGLSMWEDIVGLLLMLALRSYMTLLLQLIRGCQCGKILRVVGLRLRV